MGEYYKGIEMNEKECIFNFTNPNWQYKGVFSGILDNDAINKEMNAMFSSPKSFIAEVIAFVWVDEKGIWNFKARVKFPSGNKQTFGRSLGENSNEEEAVKAICKMPMKEKFWFSNPDGTVEGLIEVMIINDLIESIQMIKI